MDTGEVVASTVSDETPTDARTHELVTRARSKVMPFVDNDQAQRIERLVDGLLEASESEREEAQEALESELRKHSYLW